MTLEVSFRRAAREDVETAVAWYGDERPVLALAFAESLDNVIARIAEKPLQFPVVHGETRRALLGRFPYGVFFTVSVRRANVLAVVHLHRHQGAWRKRHDTEDAG